MLKKNYVAGTRSLSISAKYYITGSNYYTTKIIKRAISSLALYLVLKC